MEYGQIQQLLQPEKYPHPVVSLRLLETHISWVILTGDWAYKIKKPVDFGFLNFSTLALRQQACEDELRLNRRLCPQIYQAVVPVCRDAAGVTLSGAGEPVEYAVKMRQFDPDATLTQLLEQGAVPVEAMQRLAYRVADFHEKVAVADSALPWGEPAAVVDPVLENFSQLEPLVAEPARQVQLAQLKGEALKQIEALSHLFQARKQLGFVRELHGDLHSGNIARVEGEWLPFDCIEFNPSLRWIDTASDIAFLLMDLEYRQFPAHANRFLNAYLAYSGDLGLLPLLRFYKAYRAMVRAKVCALRMQQAHLEEAVRRPLQQDLKGYLDYAVRLQDVQVPFLIMMSGVSGSGKSTVARRLADVSGAIHLRSDVVRKRLFGLKPEQSSGSVPGDGIYTPDASEKTFARLRDDVHTALSCGYPVIVDATFLQVAHRAPFVALARELALPFAIVACSAGREELLRRIQHRQADGNDASEAGVDVMLGQLAQVEAFTDRERGYVIDADLLDDSALIRRLTHGQPDPKH